MQHLQEYIQSNKERYLNELITWLRIPSVSADPKHKGDVASAAEYCADRLREAGAENVTIYPTPGHAIVYGDKLINPDLPTVLVYGHYDVQPPDPLDLWESGPFEPVIKKTEIHPQGAIFARGSSDDKGQVYMHIKAFEAMMKHDALTCNVKFIIEGEEEIGSPNFRPFVEAHKELLDCNVVLCSDTSIVANDVPSLTTGVRGLAYMEVEVTGPSRDLHSGVYGGGVANPANVLCEIIASLLDEQRRVTIPGFYDDVQVVGPEERSEMSRIPFNQATYNKNLGIAQELGEEGYSTIERTSIRPTLDVNGIWGGYTGEGTKTVLPAKATAKISMRLVPHQRHEKIYDLVEDHLKKIAPPYVSVKVTRMHGGEPGVTPIDTPEYRAAHLAMEKTFGKSPIPKREGGYIPIVSLFRDVLSVDSILIGFGLDSDALHSPNEHFGLFNYYKGIETIPYFYHYYADLKKG